MARFFPQHPATPQQVRDFDFAAFIERNEDRFTFAKTMAQWPHFYILRWSLACEDSEEARREADRDFQLAVMQIRQIGMPRKWGRSTYIYLELGEYEYWTMGDKLETTWVLNRARLDSPARFGPER